MNNLPSKLDTFNRTLIGFDTLFDQLDRRISNRVSTNYPPHNQIKTGENEYIIEVAVTGFDKSEISVTVEDHVLIIRGENNIVEEFTDDQYIHRGLATRDFVREFPLAEFIEVVGAEIKNGMLTVKLIRNIPESAKPKIIDIVDVK